MLRTPQAITLTLAANQDMEYPIEGKYMELVACGAAGGVGVGFDGDQPQTFTPGWCYPGLAGGFRSIRFKELSGAPCTITFIVSDQSLNGQGQALLTQIAASLAAIDLDTSAIDTDVKAITTELKSGDIEDHLDTMDTAIGNCKTDLDDIKAELQGPTAAGTAVPDVAPLAGVPTIFLANSATRHGCVVQAMSTNGASIFVGFVVGMSAVAKVLELQPGQGYTWDDYRGDIYVYSVLGGDVVCGGSW